MTKKSRFFAWTTAAAVMFLSLVAWAGPRFIRSEPTAGEPVVTDTVAGLVWQGCTAGQSGSDCATGSAEEYTWQEALDHCDALVWGGHDDWVLPEIKELRSIVNNKIHNPAIDETVFPQTVSVHYWSSSVYADSTSNAWGVNFFFGTVGDFGEDGAYLVRCVRRGP